MPLPVLPEKYYRDHFFEFLDFLESNYVHVLDLHHQEFISTFRKLSDDAQCVYVRMINRKGSVFRIRGFAKYAEIKNAPLAFKEILDAGFAGTVTEETKGILIATLTKPELRHWLLKADIQTPSSLPREIIQLTAEEHLDKLKLDQLGAAGDMAIQGRLNDLEYLLFLYFGKIQTTLSLYTLRDLGIRKASDFKTNFKPRFDSKVAAQTEYELSRRIYALESEGQWQPEEWTQHAVDLKTLSPSAESLKNNLLLEIAQRVENENSNLILKALSACQAHPARERKVRLLYKLGRKDEARSLLDEMLVTPFSEEELLFTEDFLSRKFESKKLGKLSELLREARHINLSDSYFKKPERGVKDHFRSQGHLAFFSENHLWNALFGLLLWGELFESHDAALYNPFERSPADLVSPEFYEKHQAQIEAKLALLKDGKKAEFEILRTVSRHHGKLNDIFQWHPKMVEQVIEFLRASKTQNVALILRTMAQKYQTFHSGFPDLMMIKDGVARFVEVKAEGDALRSSQLAKIQLLTEAGFEVEILKVKWQADPNQVYVVVDVETTGGTAVSHRITEIGAVKIQNGKIIDEFQTLVNPGRPIPRFITQLTGITNQMVEDAPKFADIADQFAKFSESAIFVAHNARFDYGFIQREYERLDQSYVRPTMCTVAGMRKTFPGLISYGLKNLVNHFGLVLDRHHRAMSDARAAADLLLMINEKRPQVTDNSVLRI